MQDYISYTTSFMTSVEHIGWEYDRLSLNNGRRKIEWRKHDQIWSAKYS